MSLEKLACSDLIFEQRIRLGADSSVDTRGQRRQIRSIGELTDTGRFSYIYSQICLRSGMGQIYISHVLHQLAGKISGVISRYSLAHINVTRGRPAIAVGHDGLDFSKIESLSKVMKAMSGKSQARERTSSEIFAGSLDMQIGLLKP